MRSKKGFTLIELLIVVVIIGILAAIAIPKFAATKDRAYVATMESDLRNLATYEEQYAADSNGKYFGGTATNAAPMQGFTPSQNVTIVAISARRKTANVECDSDARSVGKDVLQLNGRYRLQLRAGTRHRVPGTGS